MAEDDVPAPVLSASVNDVRHFASLLRGINIVNRANVSAADDGLVITVEEARTLLATAYIFPHVFDEYAYHPEPPPPMPEKREQPKRRTKASKGKGKHREKLPSSQEGESETESETESESEDDKMKDGDWMHSSGPAGQRKPRDDTELDLDEDGNLRRADFEIPLSTLIECLNVFGTAGPSSSNGSSSGSGSKPKKGTWNREREGSDDEGGERRRGALDNYFAAAAGQEKKTGMRMSYYGAGYPLTLIIAEDASGPTTTCEITTFEPEPQLELDFESDKVVLKIILKSSWLRDALSEIDPSCEKLTFIGNAPMQDENDPFAFDGQRKRPKKAPSKPMFRIQAIGTLGSTEMDYPNDREVLETFECREDVRFSYRFNHVSRMLRALQSSVKTSLRIDEDGLLSVQFLMPAPKTRAGTSAQSFLEFRCLALDED